MIPSNSKIQSIESIDACRTLGTKLDEHLERLTRERSEAEKELASARDDLAETSEKFATAEAEFADLTSAQERVRSAEGAVAELTKAADRIRASADVATSHLRGLENRAERERQRKESRDLARRLADQEQAIVDAVNAVGQAFRDRKDLAREFNERFGMLDPVEPLRAFDLGERIVRGWRGPNFHSRDPERIERDLHYLRERFGRWVEDLLLGPIPPSGVHLQQLLRDEFDFIARQ